LNSVLNSLKKQDELGMLSYSDWLHHGLPDGFEHMKYLGYNPEAGVIINCKKYTKEKQVVLRIETFNNLLDSIHGYIDRHIDGDKKVKNDFYQNLLRSCGRKCGENFANNNFTRFTNHKDVDIETFNEILRMWFELDARSGFGRFKLEEKCTLDDNNVLHCVISIKRSFVSDNMNGPERCWFMRGYCEGVVKMFAQKAYLVNDCKVEVSCENSKSCIKKKGSGGTCDYNIIGDANLETPNMNWHIEETYSEEKWS
jgi:hypothetical protein